MSTFTVTDYFSAEPISFPYTSKMFPTAVMKVFDAVCPCCGNLTGEHRGIVTEHSSGCIEFHLGGGCRTCNLITPFRLRWYPKQNNRTMQFIDGSWLDNTTPPEKPTDKLLKFCKKLIS